VCYESADVDICRALTIEIAALSAGGGSLAMTISILNRPGGPSFMVGLRNPTVNGGPPERLSLGHRPYSVPHPERERRVGSSCQ
jgi:hypothetical protein